MLLFFFVYVHNVGTAEDRNIIAEVNFPVCPICSVIRMSALAAVF
jgi:hypothetical protein